MTVQLSLIGVIKKRGQRLPKVTHDSAAAKTKDPDRPWSLLLLPCDQLQAGRVSGDRLVLPWVSLHP